MKALVFNNIELSAILSAHAGGYLVVGHTGFTKEGACALGVAMGLYRMESAYASAQKRRGVSEKAVFDVVDAFDEKYRKGMSPEAVLAIWPWMVK